MGAKQTQLKTPVTLTMLVGSKNGGTVDTHVTFTPKNKGEDFLVEFTHGATTYSPCVSIAKMRALIKDLNGEPENPSYCIAWATSLQPRDITTRGPAGGCKVSVGVRDLCFTPTLVYSVRATLGDDIVCLKFSETTEASTAAALFGIDASTMYKWRSYAVRTTRAKLCGQGEEERQQRAQARGDIFAPCFFTKAVHSSTLIPLQQVVVTVSLPIGNINVLVPDVQWRADGSTSISSTDLLCRICECYPGSTPDSFELRAEGKVVHDDTAIDTNHHTFRIRIKPGSKAPRSMITDYVNPNVAMFTEFPTRDDSGSGGGSGGGGGGGGASAGASDGIDGVH